MKYIPLAVAALCALPSCDNGGLTSRTSTEILIDVPSLVFSRVRVGNHEIKPVEVRAGGDAPLEIKAIRLETPYEQCDRILHMLGPNEPLPAAIDSSCEFIIDERPEIPIVLESDDFRNINIRYRPTSPTPPAETFLVIESNDRQNEEVRISLTVQRSAPRISASPKVLGFEGGVAGTQHVIISNVGTGELNVGRFELVRENDPPIDQASGEPVTEFFIDADVPLPWQLGERQSVTVEVRYEPGDAGDDEAQLSFFSDDPEQGQLAVQLTTSEVFGICDVPTAVEFSGDADTLTRDLQITNSGLGPLNVLGVTIEPPDGDYAVLGQDSFQIAGGDTREVSIRYDPETREGTDARAFIRHDGENARSKSVAEQNLLGTWVDLVRNASTLPPALGIEPAAVNWNDVANGESRTGTITLTNVGGQMLTIRRASLSNPDDVGAGIQPSDLEFSIDAGAIASPTEIAPGATHEIVVRFDRPPEDTVAHLGTLVIESDAPSSPDQVIFTVTAPAE